MKSLVVIPKDGKSNRFFVTSRTAVLGQAGAQIGFDKKLKVNTVKTRTHSLFRQGQFYYKFFFRFTQEEQDSLMRNFENLLQQQGILTVFLGNQK